MRGMDRVALQNCVAMGVLSKAVEAGSVDDYVLTWDFSFHPHYPVLVVKHSSKGSSKASSSSRVEAESSPAVK